jgi:hypothetical protein
MSALTAPQQLAERLITAERFHRLAAEWRAQAGYLSDSRRMAMLRPYQEIIGMGLPVVPLILEELRVESDHWYWALEAITGENPVPSDVDGDMRRIREAWLEWGRRQGLIA